MCTWFFQTQCYHTLNRPQNIVHIASARAGKPKHSRGTLQRDACFTAGAWNQTHQTVSQVGLDTKSEHSPIGFRGLWTLMERHVLILQFRKCKIHSGDSQRVRDTDFSEWTGEPCLSQEGCGEAEPEALPGGLLNGATLRRG